jgi:transposase
LHQVLKDLHRAFTNFFEKRARSPKLKGRKRDRARFRIPQRVKIKDGGVTVPKIGDVQTFQGQDVTGETKSATLKRGADGKWYAPPVVEFEAAIVHQKFADQRRDFQHKLSTKIVGRYAAVCVDDLRWRALREPSWRNLLATRPSESSSGS